MGAVHHILFDNLSESKSVAGISPILDADFPELFLSLAQQKIPVSIITTEFILETVKSKYPNALQEYLNYDNAEMYAINNAELMFIVTDVFVLIILYKNDTINTSAGLMIFDITAINWGKELFEYYRQKSIKINNS